MSRSYFGKGTDSKLPPARVYRPGVGQVNGRPHGPRYDNPPKVAEGGPSAPNILDLLEIFNAEGSFSVEDLIALLCPPGCQATCHQLSVVSDGDKKVP